MTTGRPSPQRSADVIVVGAGIVGCATAAYLAEAGVRVMVVDARGIAAAASGRNSGVVQHPFDPVLADLHRETIALLRELEGAAPDRFRLPPRPAGLLYVADASESADATRELAAAFAASHPELEPSFVAGADLADLEPALAPDLAACRLSIGYPVGPARVTEAFASLATDRGVRFELGEAATLDLADGRVHGATVSRHRLGADVVVVAAGPWTPTVVDPGGTWRPIRPLWGAVVDVALGAPPGHVLEELEIDATIEPDAAPPRADEPTAVGAPRTARPPVAFSLVTADGRSVVGSTFEADEPDDRERAPAILARAARFVPSIATAPVRGTRRCARPLSLDGRPLVGAVPGVEGLYVAAGHGPWGISTGAASARHTADLVLRRRASPPTEVDVARFGPPRIG